MDRQVAIPSRSPTGVVLVVVTIQVSQVAASEVEWGAVLVSLYTVRHA